MISCDQLALRIYVCTKAWYLSNWLNDSYFFVCLLGNAFWAFHYNLPCVTWDFSSSMEKQAKTLFLICLGQWVIKGSIYQFSNTSRNSLHQFLSERSEPAASCRIRDLSGCGGPDVSWWAWIYCVLHSGGGVCPSQLRPSAARSVSKNELTDDSLADAPASPCWERLLFCGWIQMFFTRI